VLTAEGQGGKGSEVLELVQARPLSINTSSGKDLAVPTWTLSCKVWCRTFCVEGRHSLLTGGLRCMGKQLLYSLLVNYVASFRVLRMQDNNVLITRPYYCVWIYAVAHSRSMLQVGFDICFTILPQFYSLFIL